MIGEKLKKLRNQKGITQQELAEKIYVSREAVSKWEQNRGIPSEASLEELSKFFGINKEELLNNDDVNQMLESKEKIIIKEKRKKYILTGILSLVILVISITLVFVSLNNEKEYLSIDSGKIKYIQPYIKSMNIDENVTSTNESTKYLYDYNLVQYKKYYLYLKAVSYKNDEYELLANEFSFDYNDELIFIKKTDKCIYSKSNNISDYPYYEIYCKEEIKNISIIVSSKISDICLSLDFSPTLNGVESINNIECNKVDILDSIDSRTINELYRKVDVKLTPINKSKFLDDYSLSKMNLSISKTSGGSNDDEFHLSISNKYSRIAIPNYNFIDFSLYLTDEFEKDLEKLKNNEISVQDIFIKYGSDIVVSIDTESYFYLSIKHNGNSYIGKLEDEIKKAIQGKEYNKEQLNFLLHQDNLDVSLYTNYYEKDWLDCIEKLNKKIISDENKSIDNLYSFIEKTIPIYMLLEDNIIYEKQYEIIKEYYNSL